MIQKYQFSDAIGRERAVRLVSGLPLDGDTWILEWKRYSAKRRDIQNRLLWVWMGVIQAHMRDCYGQIASSEEWHDVFCRKLMPVDDKWILMPGGERVNIGRWRSSKATVREMADYLTMLEAYCIEGLQLILPHQDDSYHEAMSSRR